APDVLAWLQQAGYDLDTRSLLPVALRVRRWLGGCRVAPRSMATTVPRVYACGGAAGGLHGHGLPDGFALAASLVSGWLAGESAAAHKREAAGVPSEADVPRAVRRDATRLPTSRPHRYALAPAMWQD